MQTENSFIFTHTIMPSRNIPPHILTYLPIVLPRQATVNFPFTCNKTHTKPIV